MIGHGGDHWTFPWAFACILKAGVSMGGWGSFPPGSFHPVMLTSYHALGWTIGTGMEQGQFPRARSSDSTNKLGHLLDPAGSVLLSA